jgi:hypothetical protein
MQVPGWMLPSTKLCPLNPSDGVLTHGIHTNSFGVFERQILTD